MRILHVGVGGEDVVNDLCCVRILEKRGVKSPSLSALLFRERGNDSPVIRVIREEDGVRSMCRVYQLRV